MRSGIEYIYVLAASLKNKKQHEAEPRQISNRIRARENFME